MSASGRSADRASLAPALRFVPMTRRDVPLVGTIERRNYEFPWSDGIFRDCLKAGYTCDLVRLHDDTIGYGILQVAAGEAHVLNLCVDAVGQGRGVARLLLEHLMETSVRLGADTVFLEVRPSNPKAQALYASAGFNEVGRRRDYYDARGGREDAIVMARSLVAGGDPMAGVRPLH